MSAKKRMFFHRTDENVPPIMSRRYDAEFRPDTTYRSSLPDMTETVGAIEGSDVAIPQVGISGFRLPLRFAVADSDPVTLEASVAGTVSLEAGQKGINMSRIMRTFYAHRDQPAFTPRTLRTILSAYRDEIGGFNARLRVTFSYPMLRPSLRSGMEGYQYYRVAFEASLDASGRVREYIEFDFVYSSACPCSAELAEHAREYRGAYAIPHSQRSKTRVRVELAEVIAGIDDLTIEDLHAHCLNALQTETQVMVKREDEQAFAEMNGAYLKFVEDAARLLHRELNADTRIRDFQVACAHLESLHSHDAVSVISKGIPGGMAADFMEFGALVC